MVVEDDPKTSNMLREYFEAQQHKVWTLARGGDVFKRCYAELESFHKLKLPHVILLDTTLPDVDSYDLCRQLRDDQHTRDVPIILLVQEDEHRTGPLDIADWGADDFVAKPVDVKDLRWRVRRVLPGFYFPQGTVAIDRWYSKHLVAMNEPSLSRITTSEAEVYRFLWLRTFHSPVAIRVQNSDNKCLLWVKQLSGKGGYEPGKLVVDMSKSLSAIQWAFIVRHIKRASFWTLTRLELEKPESVLSFSHSNLTHQMKLSVFCEC